MKAERPPHHTPVMREDVSVSNGDEITECMKNLSLGSISVKAKDNFNSLVDDSKKDKGFTSKNDEKDVKVKSEVKKVEKEAETVSSSESSDKKDGALKEEDEKPRVKNEPPGELCARGPEPKNKWKSQTRASVLPYFANPQSNAILTNGGNLYLNSELAQLSSDVYYPETSPSFSTCEITQDFNFPPDSSSVSNDGNQFIPSIYEPSNLDEILASEVVQQPDALYSPEKPEPVSDPVGSSDVVKILTAVANDPVRWENFVKDCESSTCHVPNLSDSQTNINGYNSYEQIPPSSPQVVPKSQPSPYSTSSGSPLGPSSPNLYANTPTFSPNIPSPRGYPIDDSSNNMYTHTPYHSTAYPSPMQRPLSSCSSTSSTNQSYNDHDPIDLDVIYREPDEEDARIKLKELTQELDSTCSQACSKTKTTSMSQNLPMSRVPFSGNNSVVITTIQIPLTAQSPTMIRPTSNGSSQGSTTHYRRILPKPTDKGSPVPQAESFQGQNIPSRQLMNHERRNVSESKSHCTAKEQLLQRCNPEKKARNWARVQSLPDEDIASVDADGDTSLMILACDKDISYKAEQLYALVERCKTLPGVLCARNKAKHSALYIACMASNHDPLVAKYIAEAIMEINGDLNEVTNEGCTLIHLLCKAGDKYAEVLDHLLSVQDSRGKQCFDINKSDYEGRSPLHLAVDTHNREILCHENVKVLLKHGADALKKDGKQGSTPLHFALSTTKADQYLIDTLCKSTRLKYELVNAMNYKGDTPLHVAMAFGSSIEPQIHNCILEILLRAGASRAVRNQSGKAPLELAPEQRKGEIKKILDKYNVK